MKNFALIGAGGYIAPRHLQAIKETGNKLVAALDVHDSVGVLDSYFPDANFFTDEVAFKKYLSSQQASGDPIHYLVICSPNHLHEEHILLGLASGLDVICEKPVALNTPSIDRLMDAEQKTGKSVSTIMQLRLHPSIKALKKRIEGNPLTQQYQVTVNYITARGRWYHNSWKGDSEKSGGIATNIGIHLFDLLLWLFGDVKESIVTGHTAEKITGVLQLQQADVNWMLCIDEKELPSSIRAVDKRVFRSFTINDDMIDFSEGALSLHTASYEQIVEGNGFSLAVTAPSVKLVAAINKQPITVLANQ